MLRLQFGQLEFFLLTAKKLSLKGLFNPPAFAVLLAFVFHSLGGKELIPIFAWEVVEIIGMCSIPMGLMLIEETFTNLPAISNSRMVVEQK